MSGGEAGETITKEEHVIMCEAATHIYRHPLIRTLELARYARLMNLTCTLVSDDFYTQMCFW